MFSYFIIVTILTITSFPSSIWANLLKPINTNQPDPTFFKPTTEQLNFNPPMYLPSGVMQNRPIPTNKWWGNLLSASSTPNPADNVPIYSKPYTIKIERTEAPFGMDLRYSSFYRAFGPVNENGAPRFYIHGVGIRDFIISATEFTSAPILTVIEWDDLGVHTKLEKGSGSFISYLFTGMALVTHKYSNLTPKFSTNHAIIKINGGNPNGLFEGKKFIIELNNRMRWVIFSSNTIKLQGNGKELASTSIFNGFLRVALLTQEMPENVYDPYVDCIVTGGNYVVSSEFKYGFDFTTQGSCSNGVLHLALQHHLDNMDSTLATRIPTINLASTTRGTMYGFATKTSLHGWRFTESESINIGFYPPRKPSSNDVSKYDILNILKKDIDAPWTVKSGESYYFNGKNSLKYANLCLMANDPSVVGYDTTLKQKCIKKLQGEFSSFLANGFEFPLIYDTVYGGISSSVTFKTGDRGRDFGNAMYNDHHYHYGYWVVSSAILRYLDPSWNQISKLDNIINTLLRDVINPSSLDKWFPTFRHFDWFNGHSYSHGITPFTDGKDQESTSEDMNFNYGLMLWGKATKNSDLENLGKLLLKVNNRAINTFFLMHDDNKVHPKDFIKNKVTGIFFDNKVDYATWFCPHRECIHGIQMIPVSPINEMFRTKKFVSEEWNQILSKLDVVKAPTADNTWMSLLFTNAATIDKDMALERLKYVPLDDGLTRSWALYYAATRDSAGSIPRPDPNPVIPNPTLPSNPNPTLPSNPNPTLPFNPNPCSPFNTNPTSPPNPNPTLSPCIICGSTPPSPTASPSGNPTSDGIILKGCLIPQLLTVISMLIFL